MTTVPIQLLGMVAQSLQKTAAGMAKDPRRPQPVYPPGQVRKSRARHLLPPAHPGKITLCKKVGFLVPHPTPTTLSSSGDPKKAAKREEGRAST